jgi:hypothetical protein
MGIVSTNYLQNSGYGGRTVSRREKCLRFDEKMREDTGTER